MEEDAADASEVNALDLLFEETAIPVPRVRRVVNRRWVFLIVIDYIPGPTLAHVWPTLSTWRKIHVAFTLRRYVRQLRWLEASATTPPGPLIAQGARICESHIFGPLYSVSRYFSTVSRIAYQSSKSSMDVVGSSSESSYARAASSISGSSKRSSNSPRELGRGTEG